MFLLRPYSYSLAAIGDEMASPTGLLSYFDEMMRVMSVLTTGYEHDEAGRFIDAFRLAKTNPSPSQNLSNLSRIKNCVAKRGIDAKFSSQASNATNRDST